MTGQATFSLEEDDLAAPGLLAASPDFLAADLWLSPGPLPLAAESPEEEPESLVCLSLVAVAAALEPFLLSVR
jgi:hypothetical protein